MDKKLISAIVGSAFAGAMVTREKNLRRRGLMVHDVAFTYRMGAGFPGDVNRSHPVSIEPNLIDAAAPPTAYGQAVVQGAASVGVRPLTVGDDGLVTIWGVTARPFPIQQPTTSGFSGAVGFGSVAPPVRGQIDVVRQGYVMVQLNDVAAPPAKGGAVFVWVAATAGIHIQGGFETAATGGSTAALTASRYQYNGPSDSAGIAELIITS